MTEEPTYEELRQIIQELKKRNEQLNLTVNEFKENKKKFRNIVDASPMGIHMYTLEPDGRLIFTGANPAADRILGTENKQFIGKTIEHAFPPLVDTDIPEQYRDICLTGNTWKREEILYRDERIQGIYETYAFQTSENKMAVMFLDITDRKLTETALKESEQRFSSIIKDTEAGYFFITPDGRFRTVNHAWLKMHKYETAEEIINKHFSVTQVNSDLVDAQKHVEKLLNGAKIPHGEFTRRNKDGSIGYHSFSAHPVIRDNELIGLEGFIIDQTDQKKMEEALLKSRNLESIGILAGGIAHDFNNLLSIIIGNLSLAIYDTDPGGNVSKFLTEAMSASERAKELTKQLSVFSKGGDPVKKTDSITPLLKYAADTAAKDTNCRCEYHIDHDLRQSQFDDNQMKNVFRNIVVNAIDAMPDGGIISIKAENHVIPPGTANSELTLKPGRYIKISIRDQGCGISEEMRPLVFNPYFSTKERGEKKGMGLGLTSAYATLKKHEGLVTINSETDNGTTVSIYLPAVEGKSDIPKEGDGKIVAEKRKILIMDDEGQIRELLEAMLDRLGYDVEPVPDGQQAIQQYETAMGEGNPFDLLILDLTVKGGLGGKDTLEMLMRNYPDVKAIVASGYFDDPVMANHKAYGFIGAIKKPFSLDQLKDVLEGIW